VLVRANRAADEFDDGRHPDLSEEVQRAYVERATVRREIEHTLWTGEARRLDVSCVFVAPDLVMVHADDVTDLRESEERLRAVFAALESGLLTVDAAGRIVDANPAAAAILGMEHEQLVSDARWWEALQLRYEDGTPLVPGGAGTPGVRAMSGEPVRDVQVSITRPAGDVVDVRANYQPLRSGLLISMTDLTEGRRLHDRVVQQALHDPLTGLPNRLLFKERLEQATARTLRRRLAVLLLGLDRFRAVNDAHGHSAGDDVLTHVAERLQARLDGAQQLARIGGDEFAVLCELEDEREAATLAQRLLRAFESPVDDIFLTAAVGVAVEADDGDADLLQGADNALQRVKARGGAGYEIFDRAMGGRLRDRMRIEDGLRRAIERDELRLHYQPIVDLERGGVTVAVEALVRWQHPEEGLIGPGRFLPAAEQHGRLISAIGEWVLRQACLEVMHWPADVRVSVNVAGRELGERAFVERIIGTIAAAGVQPSRLALEITETTLMEGGEASIGGLETLAEHGLQLHLDDFGTGYSSLTRLARLPLSGIKLDRGFVARAAGERGRRIIEAALSIGRAADLGVVAEGVETTEQLELLRDCGCRYVQGYLLGRPAPPEQLGPLLLH
jgi:diguanylate cyclase (GGDEF)-like protein/PAS domain S-box-containing protein